MTKQWLLILSGWECCWQECSSFAASDSTSSSPVQKSGYSTDLNELRAKFNADKGRVRLLMSPT
jgi:hypothetical protein